MTNIGGGSYLHAKNRDNEWLRPGERILLQQSAGHGEQFSRPSPNCFSLTATPYSYTPSKGSPQLGDEYSLYRSRSVSVSSSSSANSTGTVCESEVSSNQLQNEREIVPFGLGIKPGRRNKRPSSPMWSQNSKPMSNCVVNAQDHTNCVNVESLEERSNSPASESVEWKSADSSWRSRLEDSPERQQSSLDISLSPSVSQKPSVETEDDSVSSASTVSGSGIDFFRKFVQRKGTNCKDCEDKFRREVLIDRLVSDSQIKAGLGSTRSRASTMITKNYSEDCHSDSDISDRMTTSSFNHSGIVSSLGVDMECRAKTCASRCKSHQQSDLRDLREEETQSRSSGLSRQSSIGSSTISGSGLLFLRNYLKKKKSKSRRGSCKGDPKDISAFNIVPVPFPPPSDFYGPAFLQDGCQSDNMSDSSSERRLSVCSTVADLLNEDFDCDDSELKNLDWEEWDEPLPDDISYDDLVSVISESFYSDDLDLGDLCELDWEGRKTVVANDSQVISPEERREGNCEKDKSAESQSMVESEEVVSTVNETSTDNEAVIGEGLESSRSKYGSFKSSTFLQDLEAELELPPLTPMADEKEEAVRAISRTISKYKRTGSNSSYASERALSRHSTTEQGRYSRRSNLGEEAVERNSISRLSVYSPALSDCLPELAPTEAASPAPSRRPLSQLLQYDYPPSTGSPQFMISPSPDLFHSDDSTPFYTCSNTPSTIRSLHNTRPPSQSSHIAMFARPPSYGLEHETSPQEPRLRGASLNPQPNRDSLVGNSFPHTPPSPGMARTTRPYLRHSSSNSTDSGCPLLEDKVASLSPTPSPRGNIETLSNNRNKLASFWEKSVGTGSSTTEIPLAWLSNKDDNSRSASLFQPFGSENSLSVIKNDRLSHFLDVTRRAAAERNPRNRIERRHRASTGSDCSDLLDRENPLSPLQPRRRDSFTEYFV